MIDYISQSDANNPAPIEMEEFIQMVDYYMEHGFDYSDTSYTYHTETSENTLKKALVERYPRKSYLIADKIPTWALSCEEDNKNMLI